MVLLAARKFHESFLQLGINDDNIDLRRKSLKNDLVFMIYFLLILRETLSIPS